MDGKYEENHQVVGRFLHERLSLDIKDLLCCFRTKAGLRLVNIQVKSLPTSWYFIILHHLTNNRHKYEYSPW